MVRVGARARHQPFLLLHRAADFTSDSIHELLALVRFDDRHGLVVRAALLQAHGLLQLRKLAPDQLAEARRPGRTRGQAELIHLEAADGARVRLQIRIFAREEVTTLPGFGVLHVGKHRVPAQQAEMVPGHCGVQAKDALAAPVSDPEAQDEHRGQKDEDRLDRA